MKKGLRMKITNVTRLKSGVYAHVCPVCGKIHASVSEIDIMPEFSICDCDRNGNKQPVYELFERDGKQMIRRNKPPRFVGEVTFGEFSDIENIEYLDSPANPVELARAMRKASEFLIKSSRNA